MFFIYLMIKPLVNRKTACLLLVRFENAFILAVL
jgi:hypothetical protein